MRSAVAAFLLPALALAAPLDGPGLNGPGVGTEAWADQPDPKEIQIVATRFSGSGCPQNSVSTSISPDKTVRSLKPTTCLTADTDPPPRS